MSNHKKPGYQDPALIQALKNHGLSHDTPSQLADSFRHGWVARAAVASLVNEREQAAWLAGLDEGRRQKQLEIDAVRKANLDCAAHYEAAITERKSLMRDAERYRAWRDATIRCDEYFHEKAARALPINMSPRRPPSKAEWDAAIDAARAAKGGR